MIGLLAFTGNNGTSYAAATIEHDRIELQSLNKATAQTTTFEMKIGETIKIGPLYMRPRACRTTPPTESPESAGFIQIWTAKNSKDGPSPNITEAESEWVFSGWMFASSPGISSLDHPVYDLWVLGCGKSDQDAEETLLLIKEEEGSENNREADGETENHENIVIQTDEDEEDKPVVIIDGEALSFPEAPGARDPRFQEYDEDESAPILYLE